MSLGKKLLVCVTAVVAVLCVLATADAQVCTAGGGCQKGLEVGCAPARRWFGYYPTTWRRWPSDQPAPVPTPATAPTPTPTAQEPAATVEPDQPTVMPDDATLFPSEPNSSGAPPANVEPDTMLPFENRPDELPDSLPSDTGLPGLPTGPSDTAPSNSPDAAPRVQPLPSQDAPPTMPDDNPFKDDPPEPQAPGAKATSTPSPSITSSSGTAARQGALQWRAAGDAEITAGDTAPLTPVPAGREPALIEPVAARPAKTHAMLPTVTLARQNPLRSTVERPRDPQVVTTAAWTAEGPRSHATTTNWRPNPLRAN